jgi:hypothetical protein
MAYACLVIALQRQLSMTALACSACWESSYGRTTERKLLAVTGITSGLSISTATTTMMQRNGLREWSMVKRSNFGTMPAGSLKLTVRVHSRSSQADFSVVFDSSNGAGVSSNGAGAKDLALKIRWSAGFLHRFFNVW